MPVSAECLHNTHPDMDNDETSVYRLMLQYIDSELKKVVWYSGKEVNIYLHDILRFIFTQNSSLAKVQIVSKIMEYMVPTYRKESWCVEIHNPQAGPHLKFFMM